MESSNKTFSSKWLRFHHLIFLLTLKSPKGHLLTYGSYAAKKSKKLRMLCFEWSLKAQIKSKSWCYSYACSKLGALTFHWSQDVLIVSFQSLRKVCGVQLTGTLAFFTWASRAAAFPPAGPDLHPQEICKFGIESQAHSNHKGTTLQYIKRFTSMCAI